MKNFYSFTSLENVGTGLRLKKKDKFGIENQVNQNNSDFVDYSTKDSEKILNLELNANLSLENEPISHFFKKKISDLNSIICSSDNSVIDEAEAMVSPSNVPNKSGSRKSIKIFQSCKSDDECCEDNELDLFSETSSCEFECPLEKNDDLNDKINEKFPENKKLSTK